ncbi:MAG: hypothetical protein LBM03_01040 [Erysipelotrichaceae bacterium]|jgi:hypothetical protein|nr:hypothetical protein [Erysipelotrichaceae bacterium]
MDENKIQLLIVICSRKKRQKIINSLCEYKATLFNVVYGHGSAKKENILKAFGLSFEHEKAVIFSFINKNRSKEALNMLKDVYSFGKPNTGIAFTIPVDVRPSK